MGEKADAQSLSRLTVANDGQMPIRMYIKLDLMFWGIKVPNVGMLTAEEANQVLDKEHQTKLPEIVGFDSFECPEGVNPLLCSQLSVFHYSNIQKN